MDYTKILSSGFGRPRPYERAIGCCRVYVCIFDKQHIAGIEKAAKQLGKKFQRKAHYNMLNALYIGYDNCTGIELSRGAAVVDALTEAGINCYRDEHGD